MSQYNASGDKGYVANVALADAVIVKISSGKVVVASAATDKFIGVTVGKIAASETGTIRLRSAAGTAKVKVGVGGCAVGDKLTSDATGNGTAIVTTTSGNEILGMALEAGSANDIVEFMPMNDRY